MSFVPSTWLNGGPLRYGVLSVPFSFDSNREHFLLFPVVSFS